MLHSETMPGKGVPMTATAVPAIAEVRAVEADAAAAPAHVGLRYRADIDGLRAIAVSLVVLYHAGLGALPGGFVGVDIFFVISGYLITRVIAGDLERGRFSFAEFYRRRIKRLLPAYAVVAFATLAAGLLISLPFHLRDTAQGVASSAVYLSNFWFWREAGYFAGLAEIKPFLHTWSLSVEEQFYVVFPPLLLIATWAKLGRVANTVLFTVVLIGSLVLAQLLLTRDPSASFYLLPSRAWELMIGAGLALANWPTPGDARIRNALVAAGLAAIVASALLLRAEEGFPGLSALPACLGSVLILWAGGRGDALGRGALENRPIVFIGRISYSLYLWHWPLFAFYRYYFFQAPPLPIALALVAVSVLLAWASWRFVEAPFRKRDRLPGRQSFAFAAGVSGALLAVCVSIQFADGLPSRYPANLRPLMANAQAEARRPRCAINGELMADPARPCLFGADRAAPGTAVWGDSHAQALVQSLDAGFAGEGRAFRLFGHNGCAPIPGVDNDIAGGILPCDNYAERVLRIIERDPAIADVVLSSRWSAYIKGSYGPMELENGVGIAIRPVAGLPDAPVAIAYLARLERTVARLLAAGKRVVIVLPVPEMGYDVPQVVAMLKVRGDDPDRLELSRSIYRDRNREVIASMRKLARDPRVTLIDPTRGICDARSCRMMIGDVPAFDDDDHLSRAAADRLAPDILAATVAAARATP